MFGFIIFLREKNDLFPKILREFLSKSYYGLPVSHVAVNLLMKSCYKVMTFEFAYDQTDLLNEF